MKKKKIKVLFLIVTMCNFFCYLYLHISRYLYYVLHFQKKKMKNNVCDNFNQTNFLLYCTYNLFFFM